MRSHPRPFQLGFCGFLGLLLTLLSGCTSDLSEVCSGKYDHTVTDAMVRLEPYMESRSLTRSVASLATHESAPVMSPVMSNEEREQWQSWSESELKRIEGYLDWANLHRDEFPGSELARRRLTDVANRLVAFHGYSGAGRVDRMLSSLKTLESDRREIQAHFCKIR
jgi:uncharacterized protein YceK